MNKTWYVTRNRYGIRVYYEAPLTAVEYGIKKTMWLWMVKLVVLYKDAALRNDQIGNPVLTFIELLWKYYCYDNTDMGNMS